MLVFEVDNLIGNVNITYTRLQRLWLILCNCLSQDTLLKIKGKQMNINKKEFEVFAKEPAKVIKTSADFRR